MLAPISWGTTYITVTEFLPPDSPVLIAALRVLPAGLVLVAIGWWRSRWMPRGREWRPLLIWGMCNFGLFFPLLILTADRLPGGVAAAAAGMQPLLVVLMTWLLVGRTPQRLEVIVGVVAAIGVGMVVLRPGASLDRLGLLAAVLANISFATGVVLTRRFPAPTDRITATGLQLLIAAVVLVPLALAVDGLPDSLTGRNIAGFLYLSLAGTALAYLLWFRGIPRLPVQAPPLLGLATPVTGATLGWLVRDERFTPVQMLGFTITIAAIAWGAIMASRAQPLLR
jgi:probable blue pigment (indigoidine) exporter